MGPPPQNPPAHGCDIVTHSDFSISLNQISYPNELLQSSIVAQECRRSLEMLNVTAHFTLPGVELHNSY
jgi:hypothetical protein